MCSLVFLLLLFPEGRTCEKLKHHQVSMRPTHMTFYFFVCAFLEAFPLYGQQALAPFQAVFAISRQDQVLHFQLSCAKAGTDSIAQSVSRLLLW